ncbi:hypothetical protein [Arthrobacter globiformis]|nr:hypothetical protein [Arthrobacter globiformis]MDQ0864650.1 hypothetical protein [Arthrobacter globiformis]
MTRTSLHRARNIHQAMAIQHDEIAIIGVLSALSLDGRITRLLGLRLS